MNVEGWCNQLLDNGKHWESVNKVKVMWHHVPEVWIPFNVQDVGTYPVVQCWHISCSEVLAHTL